MGAGLVPGHGHIHAAVTGLGRHAVRGPGQRDRSRNRRRCGTPPGPARCRVRGGPSRHRCGRSPHGRRRPRRTDPSPVRSSSGPLVSVTCTEPSPVRMLRASRNPRARTLPSPSLTFTVTPRGTSMRCLAEQSLIEAGALHPQHQPVVLHRPGHLGVLADDDRALEPPGDLDLAGRVLLGGDDLQGGVVGVDGEGAARQTEGPVVGFLVVPGGRPAGAEPGDENHDGTGDGDRAGRTVRVVPMVSPW